MQQLSNRTRQFVLPAAVGLVCFVVLQLYAVISGVSSLLFPSPLSVVQFIGTHFWMFVDNASVTVAEILLGFAAGTVLGVAIGICINASRNFRDATYPWLVASQMVPVAAIAPILILWFGFTILPKVIVVTLIAFFPVAVNTADGLRSVDNEMVRLLKSMGATRRKILCSVSIPSALPHLFSGLRVAMALSVVGAVFGEWVGSSKGLGFLMLNYNNKLNTPGLFAAVLFLSVIGIILFFLVGLVERVVLPWKTNTNL